MLASGSSDDTVILWDVETQSRIGQPLRANEGTVLSVSFRPDDGRTLAAANGNTITLWDVETQNRIGQPLKGHVSSIRSVAFRPDGNALVSESADGSVILWDIAAAHPLGQTLNGPTTTVRSVAFNPNGNLLAAGSRDGTITVWDAESGEMLSQMLGTEDTGSVHSLAFRPGSQEDILAASTGYDIFLWDIKKRQFVGQQWRGHSDIINSIAFRPDGKILASGGDDKSIVLWDVLTGQRIGEPMRGHDGAVWSLAFSPDGKMLASASEDETILLWDVTTRQPIGQPLREHSFSVLSVAFSPDGNLLASGGADDTIILWNLETRQPVGEPLSRHTSDVLSVTFSPDGRILASAGEDNTVILWEVETGQAIGQPLSNHTDSIWSVAIRPDGKKLASGGYDTYVVLWDIDPQSLIAKACERVRRNFLQAQWAQYFPNEEYRKTCEQFPKHRSFYQALATRILLDSNEPQRVRKALDEVKLAMEQDLPIKNPAADASGIVAEMAVSGVLEEVDNNKWEEALSLMDQTNAQHLSLEPLLTDAEFIQKLCWNGSLEGYATQVLAYCEQAVDFIPDLSYLRDMASTVAHGPESTDEPYLLYDICWDGSLDGYAAQVLEFCEQAVHLAPDDPDIRDGRGLARALAGDFGGAIEDFQFYVDVGGNQSLIEERRSWILALQAGIDPFTSAVQEQLRNP
jgi:WD40 repeat protein